MEAPPSDLDEILSAGRSLLELAERRGIRPRPSPGSLGAALLRGSPEWKNRRPAPSFISEFARTHLPGNYYAVSTRMKGKRLEHAYYMDQEASHHKVAASIPLPDPRTLHARGFYRAAEKGEYRRWTDDLSILKGDFGLLCCVVNVGILPPTKIHLYPPWAHEHGTKARWLWTPDIRLLDDPRMDFYHVCCAFTSHRIDTALWEYAEWALEQRSREGSSVYKGSLLAAYGMLACRSDRPIRLLSVHGRGPAPRQHVMELPLLPEVYMSEVQNRRTPTVQNVIARGVIEAETRARSLEYARRLESEGIPVAQIYADGLLAVTDQLPLDIPEHWRIAASLTRVAAPKPNQIVSDQLVRLPGILGSAREAYSTAWEAPSPRESARERELASQLD